MQIKGPLDMNEFVDEEIDVAYELEITGPNPDFKETVDHDGPNPKFKETVEYDGPNPKLERIADHDLENEIKKHQKYLRDLTLKDPQKLVKQIEALEKEKVFREKRKAQVNLNQGPRPAAQLHGDSGWPRPGRATHFKSVNDITAKTDCSGRMSNGHETNGPAFSEDVVLLNSRKGKGPFTQSSPNTEGSASDKRKDTCRILSPAFRSGLRSSSRRCNECSSANHDHTCTCRFYGKPNTRSTLSAKEPPKRNSSPEPAPGRKANGVNKRARKEEKIVELMSSEDDEVKETKEALADCQIASQRKGHGSRGSLSPSMESVRIAYPSRDDPEAVEVGCNDLHRLEPLEFLNDTLIDFYIKYIQRPEVLTVEDKNRFHFFNSFFYKKLSEIVGGQNKKTVADLSKLRKWTRNTNIFEKEYLFVPIHDKWHWSLAIVCHPGATSEDTGSQRCILHLDSLSPGHKSNNVFRLLRTYLIAEWEHQANNDGVGDLFETLSPEGFVVKKISVPQQENESDCGLFLLHYVELFIKEAPSSIKLSDLNQGRLFGVDWFEPKQAHGLRREYKQLLETFFHAEASRATENAETIESSSWQGHCHGSENGLQDDTQHGNLSAVIKKCCNSPGQPLATELVNRHDTPDSIVPNIESLSGVSSSKALQMEHAQQHSVDHASRIDENIRTCSEGNSGDPRKSNECSTASVLGSSADSESCPGNKPSSGGSAGNTKEMKKLDQSKSCKRDLGGDDQSGIPLVVDLSIQEDLRSAG